MVSRILIVDDECDLVELMRFRLAGLGCEFIVANDGVHALSQARQFKPDLILLDILLPDLDGLSVCEILRRQPATQETPIIFISALSGDVTKRTVPLCMPKTFLPSRSISRGLEHRIASLLHWETCREMINSERGGRRTEDKPLIFFGTSDNKNRPLLPRGLHLTPSCFPYFIFIAALNLLHEHST